MGRVDAPDQPLAPPGGHSDRRIYDLHEYEEGESDLVRFATREQEQGWAREAEGRGVRVPLRQQYCWRRGLRQGHGGRGDMPPSLRPGPLVTASHRRFSDQVFKNS